jgi:putative transposase
MKNISTYKSQEKSHSGHKSNQRKGKYSRKFRGIPPSDKEVEGPTSAAEEPPQQRDFRLDELNEEQLKIYAENSQLVSLMKNGVRAGEAIRRVGAKRSERSARHLFRRFERHGFSGLLDKRWFRSIEPRVFTPEVQGITLAWYFARSAAGPRAIWNQVCKVCRERGLKEPCETSVKNFLENLDESLKVIRGGKLGLRKLDQEAKPVIRFENTKYANERWQGDHTPLPIWVKLRVNGVWKPFHAYFTLLLDAHTRAIPDHVTSANYPNSWSIALAFRRAILPKTGMKCNICGIPAIFESDRGKDFLSHAVRATLASLGTVCDPDPPYYPNMKGKIERFFKTLESGCLSILPGYMPQVGTTEGAAIKRVHEFLTIQQLDQEITRWIDEVYHQRKHSETGRAPAEFWEATKHLQLPTSVDDLNLLILKHDKECTVINTGIKLTLGGVEHRFWSPELAYYWKRRVRLRYNPDDMESVLVYCAATGEYLCEAFDMLSDTPRYTIKDIKRTRSQWKRGLLERTRGYMETVYADDRKKAEREEREEARRLAETMEAEDADLAVESDAADDYGDLLDLFKKQDRRRS